ncbi:MAG: cell wall-active antibiotics response protein [Actinobacteria bacterium]|nr:cell wall-active antibiotics response protein [Actinomycetota bacterium]
MNGRAGRLILGLIILLIGLGWFFQAAGLIDHLAWDWILPAILIVVGLALIADAKGRRHGGLIALGVILTLILVAGGGRAVNVDTTTSAVGDRHERITSMTDLKDTSMFAGSLTLDLRDLDLPSGTTKIDISVFAGEIEIRVPSDATVEVNANTLFGEINAFGEQRSGVGVGLDKTSSGDSDRTLVLNVSAFAGQIGVSR